MKTVEFRGTALADLRAFPDSARREAGYQLDRLQNGQAPTDWKPMVTVGKGVQEIRIRDEAGAFRVIYIARLAAAIYVLHCFQKKSKSGISTPKQDIELIKERLRWARQADRQAKP